MSVTSARCRVRLIPRRPDLSAGGTDLSESAWWFQTLCCFIGVVSVVDAYLVHRFIDSILYLEKNPICRRLIELDAEHLSVFLSAKTLGTLTVLCILRLIFVRCREYSVPITWAVAAYQAGLMVYLVS